MSSETFPATLKISAYDYTRSSWHETSVQRTRDGSELRTDWGGDGYRWNFSVIAIGSTQRTTLENFFLARRGRWDSFFFIDKDDAVSRLVRFDQDSLEAQRVGGVYVYQYPIALVTLG